MYAPGSPSSALQMTYLGSPFALRVESHFQPGREAAAAPAAQVRLDDLLDDSLGLHPRERLGERRVAADREVVVDARRVDLPVHPEDEPRLLLVERNVVLVEDLLLRDGIPVDEAVDDLVLEHGLRDDLRRVVELHALVEYLLRVNDDERAALAESVAAARPHVDRALELLLLDLRAEVVDELLRAVREAARARAYDDARLLRIARLPQRRPAGSRALSPI